MTTLLLFALAIIIWYQTVYLPLKASWLEDRVVDDAAKKVIDHSTATNTNMSIIRTYPAGSEDNETIMKDKDEEYLLILTKQCTLRIADRYGKVWWEIGKPQQGVYQNRVHITSATGEIRIAYRRKRRGAWVNNGAVGRKEPIKDFSVVLRTTGELGFFSAGKLVSSVNAVEKSVLNVNEYIQSTDKRQMRIGATSLAISEDGVLVLKSGVYEYEINKVLPHLSAAPYTLRVQPDGLAVLMNARDEEVWTSLVPVRDKVPATLRLTENTAGMYGLNLVKEFARLK